MTHPGADRGPAAIMLAVGAAVLLLIVILIGAVAGITGQQAAACQAQPAASTAAASIPARYLADYEKAGAEYGIPWTVLAGIGTVESANGQSTAPGVHSGTNPYGAAGPMQFGTGGAAGNTWGGAPVHPASEHTGGYGIDGDGDGIADVYDPGDAIPSAAWFLQAHGAAADLQAALFDWNHSAAYVSDVLSWAARYAAGGAQAVSAAEQPAVPAGRCRAAARRDRRQGHRLRRGPARQAVPVGGHRPGRLRLLRAGHDGLPRRRHQHPADLARAVAVRRADPATGRAARRPGVLRRRRRDAAGTRDTSAS